MRFVVLAAVLVVGRAFIAPIGAQGRDSLRLPPEVAREAASLYNAAGGLRSDSRLEIEAGRVVRGDVAVLRGPLIIAGHVTGRVTAINADVILQRGAQIDGELLVVGGDLEGHDVARIGGTTRLYRRRLHFKTRDEQMIAEVEGDALGAPGTSDSWWRRWERRRTSRQPGRFLVASAGAYNRVEGLPIHLGPQFRFVSRGFTTEVSALAIARSASSFASESIDVGHDARFEVRTRGREGVAAGGRVFNLVDAVETWQQSDLEVGLASFVLRRDYRDYYGRRGGQASVSLFARALGGDLTLAYGHERWGVRIRRDPFTLFRNEVPWRPNPVLDQGRFHLINATLRADTRNDEDRPWSGWYILADVERGIGDLIALGPTSPGVRLSGGGGRGRTSYSRGLLDVRRYNRLSPRSQVNLRLVTGGWLGGEELPLQRRFSVDGPGALPGYDFRMNERGADVATCGDGGFPPGGRPAQCERLALVQAEFRRDLRFDLLGHADWDDVFQAGENAAWIIFFDSGRGWLVRRDNDDVGYSPTALPSLSTFRSDVGIGIDLRLIGFYVAKSLSDGSEPLNFFVRLRHRF